MVSVKLVNDLEGLIHAVLVSLNLEQILRLLDFGRRDPGHGPNIVTHFVRKCCCDLRLHLHFAGDEPVCELLQLALRLADLLRGPLDLDHGLLLHQRELGPSCIFDVLDHRVFAIWACLDHNMDTDVASKKEAVTHFQRLLPAAVVPVALVGPAVLATPASIIVIPVSFVNLCQRNSFCLFSSCLVVSEDEEPLGLAGIALQEAEGLCFLLNSAQSHALENAGNSLKVMRNVHNRHIVSIMGVHIHGARPLLQQPSEVFSCAPSSWKRSSHKGSMSDILQDASAGLGKLLAGRTVLPQGEGELLVSQWNRVASPLVWAAMVGDVLGVEIRQLRLNRRHDLELCPRPPGSGSEDGQVFRVSRTSTRTLVVTEEHKGAPLLLASPEEVSLRASYEADTARWHRDHGQIPVIVLVGSDVHRPDSLSTNKVDVLPRSASLRICADDLHRAVVLVQLQCCSRHPGDLVLRFAAAAQDESRIHVGQLKDLCCLPTLTADLLDAFCIGLARAAAARHAVLRCKQISRRDGPTLLLEEAIDFCPSLVHSIRSSREGQLQLLLVYLSHDQMPEVVQLVEALLSQSRNFLQLLLLEMHLVGHEGAQKGLQIFACIRDNREDSRKDNLLLCLLHLYANSSSVSDLFQDRRRAICCFSNKDVERDAARGRKLLVHSEAEDVLLKLLLCQIYLLGISLDQHIVRALLSQPSAAGLLDGLELLLVQGGTDRLTSADLRLRKLLALVVAIAPVPVKELLLGLSWRPGSDELLHLPFSLTSAPRCAKNEKSVRRVHISLQEAEGVCFVLDVSEGCAFENTSQFPRHLHLRGIASTANVNVDGPNALLLQPGDVVPRSLSFGPNAGHVGNVANVLQDAATRVSQFSSRCPLLPQGEGQLVTCQRHGVDGPALLCCLHVANFARVVSW
mmetsp:Transcript_78600/g.188572  ORF Transcript_78600/g.188572 Transcript_78600/m.188572 type:complete len:910 (-) Transcript_78600:664-3393(-)